MQSYTMTHLKQLEQESIHVIREVVAEFRNPVMLYSVGKDSAVMVRLAQKAFYPGRFPFPLMHVDTGYKFPEMYEFRDRFVESIGARLIVERNEEWIGKGAHPSTLGNDKCCQMLKTRGLLDALGKHGFDAAFGGARRDEEKSRAKERFFSMRDEFGQWDPKNQRPELWNLYNAELGEGESVRVFPLSNWTELDVWQYIKLEEHPPGAPVLRPAAAGPWTWAASSCRPSTWRRSTATASWASPRTTWWCATAASAAWAASPAPAPWSPRPPTSTASSPRCWPPAARSARTASST